MKKIILILLTLVFFNANAKISNLPEFNGNGYVQDFANVLNQNDLNSLNNTLREFKKTTSFELAIVTITDLNGNDIETYSNQLFRKWGIGNKTNNGILLLLAINNRKSRIEVGRGIEPYITDYYSKQILNDIKPYLRDKNYNQAFKYVIEQVISLSNKAKNENDITYKNANKSSTKIVSDKPIDDSVIYIIITVMILLGLIMCLLFWIDGKNKSFDNFIYENQYNKRNIINFIKDLKNRYNGVTNSIESKYQLKFKDVLNQFNNTIIQYEGRLEKLNLIYKKITLFDQSNIEIYNEFYKILYKACVESMNSYAKIIKDIHGYILADKKEIEKIEQEKELIQEANKLLQRCSVEYFNSLYDEKCNEFIKEYPKFRFIEKLDVEELITNLKDILNKCSNLGTNNQELETAIFSIKTYETDIIEYKSNKDKFCKKMELKINDWVNEYEKLKTKSYNTNDVRKHSSNICDNIVTEWAILLANKDYITANDKIDTFVKSMDIIKNDIFYEESCKNLYKNDLIELLSYDGYDENLYKSKIYEYNISMENANKYYQNNSFNQAFKLYNNCIIIIDNIRNDIDKRNKDEAERIRQESIKNTPKTSKSSGYSGYSGYSAYDLTKNDDTPSYTSPSSYTNYDSSSSNDSFSGGSSDGGGSSNDW